VDDWNRVKGKQTVEKSDLSIGRLVSMIESGELQLPEMQRQYVWRATRVRDLLDSLYRGYPSGAILVWKTDEEQPTRSLAVSPETNSGMTRLLLLDGQQRLTSLYAVLRGKPVKVRGRQKPIDILFNLEHPERLEEAIEVEEESDDVTVDSDDDSEDEDSDETLQERFKKLTFVVASKRLAALPNWVSVSEVMKSTSDIEIIFQAGVTDLKDPRLAKYSQRLQRLRSIGSYQYVVHVLDKSLDYEEVTEIFVRVNSLGVKLRSSDLALAQITARWKNLLPLLEAFQDECEERGFTLDLGVLVRAMVVVASGQSRFKTLRNISTEELQKGWKDAQDGIRFAVNFLRANGQIEDESLLSSPFFILTAAYLFHRNDGRLSDSESRELLEWILVGSGRGYYSGSSETKLDADLDQIRRGGGIRALLQRLETTFGRLRFDLGDIEGKSIKSGLFALAFLALRRKGAKDWRSGLEISLLHRGRQHLIQAHHIFPKARLKDRYPKRETNEIANLAFLGGTTNRKISSEPAVDYLPKVVESRGVGALEAQCVPTDPGLWELDRYLEFLDTRRRALVAEINRMLDSL